MQMQANSVAIPPSRGQTSSSGQGGLSRPEGLSRLDGGSIAPSQKSILTLKYLI
jgi:hypothetical protein